MREHHASLHHPGPDGTGPGPGRRHRGPPERRRQLGGRAAPRTPLMLGVATIGGLGGTSPRGRGFAILGWAYFATVFLGLSDRNLARLPTSRLLLLVHQRVAPPQTYSITLSKVGQAGSMGRAMVLLSNVG